MTESEDAQAELWEVKVLVWSLFSQGDEIWGDFVMEGLILNKEVMPQKCYKIYKVN